MNKNKIEEEFFQIVYILSYIIGRPLDIKNIKYTAFNSITYNDEKYIFPDNKYGYIGIFPIEEIYNSCYEAVNYIEQNELGDDINEDILHEALKRALLRHAFYCI